jgi:hypothetical protein
MNSEKIKIGQTLICCSKLCSNFIFGKEYKLTDISYSGGTYEFIDEDGDWAGIGSSFFTTKEKFNQLTKDDVLNNDNEIEESRKEFEFFREQQWQDFLCDECQNCKELNEKFGNENYVATCDKCLDRRLEVNIDSIRFV